MDYSKLPLLVTGGAGYIGSHTIIELMKQGFTDIVIIDNFANSSPVSIDRLHTILRRIERIPKYSLTHYNLDLSDLTTGSKLCEICTKHSIFACLHFAGLKSVGESIKMPVEYFANNINSTLNLINALTQSRSKTTFKTSSSSPSSSRSSSSSCSSVNLIFSSSATVYGSKIKSPISEENEIGRNITNPYGRTKVMIEEILFDMKRSESSNPSLRYNICNLRYFNPIGSHNSGLIGENPIGVPNNLMPYLLQVAVGRREKLFVFGSDYDTIDGTGVRDYIHVSDLARGHVHALIYDIIPKFLQTSEKTAQNEGNARNEVSVYNLGTGSGTSVLELKNALEKFVTPKKIEFELVARRDGDVGTVFANCDKAANKILFRSKCSIEDACRDAWKWQQNNPNGFDTKLKQEDIDRLVEEALQQRKEESEERRLSKL